MEIFSNPYLDIKNSLTVWRTYVNAILNGDDTNNSTNEMKRSAGQTLWTILPQFYHQTGRSAGSHCHSAATAMLAFLLNFLKPEEMSWSDACTTFSATYGH